MQENGSRNHHSPLAENHYRTINELLNWAPDDVTIAVCAGRINREMIRNWRRGLARPAPWIVDAITTQIERQARAALDLANRARASAGPGKGWNKGAKTLAVWRERKARERDAKEKAAELAALHRTPEDES
jgi:hypothetical protein